MEAPNNNPLRGVATTTHVDQSKINSENSNIEDSKLQKVMKLTASLISPSHHSKKTLKEKKFKKKKSGSFSKSESKKKDEIESDQEIGISQINERKFIGVSTKLHPWESLPRFAPHHLQTMAFHQLELGKLISSNSEKLESIQLHFKHSDQPILEVTTFVDPNRNQVNVDPSFLKLQQLKKKVTSSSLKIGDAYVNNYPKINDAAQINCDAYHCELHPDYGFSILADGCGWGLNSREAAQRAISAATQFINQMVKCNSQSINTAKTMAYILIQGIAMAHEAIVTGKKIAQDAGMTTINICFAFANPEGNKFLLVAGIGDCKAFIAVKDRGSYQVIDISAAKRLGFDAKHSGGRIGPYIGKDYRDPDLQNLSVCCIPIPKDDYFILNMSDGVHDNLNPEQLGKFPSEVDSKLPAETKWSDLQADKRSELNSSFQNKLLEKLITDSNSVAQLNLNGICRYIASYCYELTSFGRNFLNENRYESEPEDKKLNPGKMDHSSVVIFKF